MSTIGPRLGLVNDPVANGLREKCNAFCDLYLPFQLSRPARYGIIQPGRRIDV